MRMMQLLIRTLTSADLSLCRKYEEIDPPEVDDFVYVTDSTYSRKVLLRMEHVFLRVLGFKMTAPTVYQFVRQLVSIQSVCRRTENLTLVSKNQTPVRRVRIGLCL